MSLDDPQDGRRRWRELPIDPDVAPSDLPPLRERVTRLLAERSDVLGVIALGGAFGSLARWGVGKALPHDPGTVPWSTAIANITGCFALGVLMVLVVERWPDRRLLRPLVGTGLLGGYTTFSTYAVDTRTLAAAGRPAVAAAYLVGTLALGLLAAVAGLRAAERLLR